MLTYEGNGTAPASSADERTKLKRSLGLWMAVVSDNGQGFDPESELTGFGLVGMRERVALVEGTLTIESRPGVGTTLRAVLPSRRAGADQSGRSLASGTHASSRPSSGFPQPRDR